MNPFEFLGWSITISAAVIIVGIGVAVAAAIVTSAVLSAKGKIDK